MIQHLIIGASMSLMLGFVLVNIMTGCVDWSQPNCVTPGQLWEYVVSWK